MLKKTATAL